MQKERQVIARINAFLESSDWVNSPTSREILASYTECCVEINSRLDQCSALLGRKMTVEAVNLADREPSLFEMVPLLNFPRLPEFLELCDLYDWSAPPQLNMAVFEQLKTASAGLSSLMELINEYRRIARGRDLRQKIGLLREIAKQDAQNPEWRQNQKQLETEFLPELIEQAKNAIQQNDFAQLEKLQKELTQPDWQIPVPEMVLSKVRRILDEHHLEELKREAAKILEEVNLAYSAFDQAQLEDALARWDMICRIEDYEPEQNETVQIQDAGEWLQERKKKEEARLAFAASQKQVTYLLDSGASPEEVEKEFATLSSFEQPIPDYLSDRVAMYRQLCESEERHRRILRTVKHVTIGAVTLLVLGIIGYVILYLQIEKYQANRLRAVIESGKLVEAQTMMKSIEESYPMIARGAKITELRGDLSRLEYEITTRQEDFLDRIADVDKELGKKFPDAKYIESKFADCDELVYFDEDKRMLAEKREEFTRRMAAARREADRVFLDRVQQLKDTRAEFFGFIGKHDFTNAERVLEQFHEIALQAADIEGVSEENRKEYAELLASYGTLFQFYEDDKAAQALIFKLQQAVFAANTASAVAEAVADFNKSLAGRKLQPEEQAFVDALAGDSAALMAIAAYQEKPAPERIPAETSVAFFQDAANAVELSESFAAARKNMEASFELLMTSVMRNRLRMFCFQEQGGRVVTVYFPESSAVSSMSDAGSHKLQFQDDGGRLVEIEVGLISASVRIGETYYPNIRPLYPAVLKRNALQAAVAPHQRHVSEILTMLRGLEGVQFEAKIVEALRRIISDPYCNPYWKLQLCSRLTGAMQKIKFIDTKYYDQLNALATELLAADSSGEGMENELLNGKISAELAKLKMDELFGNLAANHFLVGLIQEAPARKLQFLGVIQRKDGATVFRKSKYVERESGEVWCFDDKRGGCWLAGSFHGDEISWDPKVRDRVGSCVAFTPADADDTVLLIANDRDKAKAVGLVEVPWPAFWPRNVMEGEN